MKLLLKRSQKNAALFSLVPLKIGTGNIFNLNVEIEYDDEERQLANKYRINHMAFNTDDPVEEVKKAFKTALIPSFLVFVVAFIFTWVMTAISVGLIVLIVMTIIYFKTMREQVVIGQLLEGGRTFRCDSIVELIHKEAWLQHMSQCLRQVLESAKHWDDREIKEIEPLTQEDAKRFVLKNL